MITTIARIWLHVSMALVCMVMLGLWVWSIYTAFAEHNYTPVIVITFALSVIAAGFIAAWE